MSRNRRSENWLHIVRNAGFTCAGTVASHVPEYAHAAVATINRLFDIERESGAANETPEQRKMRRENQAKPILDELKLWLESELRELMPKSPSAQAIGYSLRHWLALTRYLEDGRTKIDNNAAERCVWWCIFRP